MQEVVILVSKLCLIAITCITLIIYLISSSVIDNVFFNKVSSLNIYGIYFVNLYLLLFLTYLVLSILLLFIWNIWIKGSLPKALNLCKQNNSNALNGCFSVK